MEVNQVPRTNMAESETGCCPRFHPEEWDEQEFRLRDKLFVKGRTRSFLHIPLNMSRMMTRTMARIRAAGAESPDRFLLLSHEASPWRGEHYFWVERGVRGLENVRLSGDFLAKVFEGPFKDARMWAGEMERFVRSRGRELKKLYFYYTTCPACARHYGKNYVVAFGQVN